MSKPTLTQGERFVLALVACKMERGWPAVTLNREQIPRAKQLRDFGLLESFDCQMATLWVITPAGRERWLESETDREASEG